MGKRITQIIVAAFVLCGVAHLAACSSSPRPSPTAVPQQPKMATMASMIEDRDRHIEMLESHIERLQSQNSSTPQRTIPRPTPTPALQQITSGLVRDVESVGFRMDALFGTIQNCIRRGDIDWSRYTSSFGRIGDELGAIARDSADGVLNTYSVNDVRRAVSNAHNVMDEIERQCIK